MPEVRQAGKALSRRRSMRELLEVAWAKSRAPGLGRRRKKSSTRESGQVLPIKGTKCNGNEATRKTKQQLKMLRMKRLESKSKPALDSGG